MMFLLLLQDIAAGMVRVKGSGQARRLKMGEERKRTPAKRGLQMSDGVFKNGVLFVQPEKIEKFASPLKPHGGQVANGGAFPRKKGFKGKKKGKEERE